jgi:hypothetical protein
MWKRIKEQFNALTESLEAREKRIYEAQYYELEIDELCETHQCNPEALTAAQTRQARTTAAVLADAQIAKLKQQRRSIQADSGLFRVVYGTGFGKKSQLNEEPRNTTDFSEKENKRLDKSNKRRNFHTQDQYKFFSGSLFYLVYHLVYVKGTLYDSKLSSTLKKNVGTDGVIKKNITGYYQESKKLLGFKALFKFNVNSLWNPIRAIKFCLIYLRYATYYAFQLGLPKNANPGRIRIFFHFIAMLIVESLIKVYSSLFDIVEYAKKNPFTFTLTLLVVSTLIMVAIFFPGSVGAFFFVEPLVKALTTLFVKANIFMKIGLVVAGIYGAFATTTLLIQLKETMTGTLMAMKRIVTDKDFWLYQLGRWIWKGMKDIHEKCFPKDAMAELEKAANAAGVSDVETTKPVVEMVTIKSGAPISTSSTEVTIQPQAPLTNNNNNKIEEDITVVPASPTAKPVIIEDEDLHNDTASSAGDSDNDEDAEDILYWHEMLTKEDEMQAVPVTNNNNNNQGTGAMLVTSWQDSNARSRTDTILGNNGVLGNLLKIAYGSNTNNNNARQHETGMVGSEYRPRTMSYNANSDQKK